MNILEIDPSQGARESIETDQIAYLPRDLCPLRHSGPCTGVLAVLEMETGEVEQSMLAHSSVIPRSSRKRISLVIEEAGEGGVG